MNSKEASAARQRLERLKGYLAQDPENVALRADVFQTALSVGELEVASREVSAALARNPGDALWEHRRAQVQLASKDFAGAQGTLEQLIERGERAAAIIHDLAFAHLSKGECAAAAELVEPALGQSDADGAAAWALWLRAQHHLQRVEDALGAVRKQLQGGGVSSEALGVASLMAIDTGNLEEAEAWSSAALQDGDSQMEALVARATLALLASDFAGALGWFQHALDVSPEDGRTWSGVGLAKLAAKDTEGADRAFALAVRGVPGHIGTWIGWGWCHLAAGRAQDALLKFEHALELDRNVGESHGCLAIAQACLGRRADAESEIRLALKLDPRGVAARYAQAVLAGKAGDPATLRQLTALALRRHPGRKEITPST